MTKREKQYISKMNDDFSHLLQDIVTTDEIEHEDKEEILVSMKESIEDEIRHIRSCE